MEWELQAGLKLALWSHSLVYGGKITNLLT
jgi:hypothetical protein